MRVAIERRDARCVVLGVPRIRPVVGNNYTELRCRSKHNPRTLIHAAGIIMRCDPPGLRRAVDPHRHRNRGRWTEARTIGHPNIIACPVERAAAVDHARCRVGVSERLTVVVVGRGVKNMSRTARSPTSRLVQVPNAAEVACPVLVPSI